MERWFLTQKYLQWVVINKQIEQLNKRDIFSKNATTYLPVVSKLQELYSKLQKNLEEVLVACEEAYTERQEQWEVARIQWDWDAAQSLLSWAEQSIVKERENIVALCEQKKIHETQIWHIRDHIREITAKSWYSTTELNTLLQDINKEEKNIVRIDTAIWVSERLITSNEQGKITLEQEIHGLNKQLEIIRNEKKFDKEYYRKKIFDVFTKWYDSRPKKAINTYSTTEELFGIKPIEKDTNLMKDWERPRTWLSISWSTPNNTNQKLQYNKVVWIKNTLDALWVILDNNAIHQFNDVLYIYAKDIDKGIIVSNKKFVIWEKEVFTHATFVIPGAPTFQTDWWITFPTPLYARRIRFDNEDKREKDVLDALLKDNNDEQFKKVIHTYNEEKWSGIRLVQEKMLPIAEQATEACVVKQIIRAHFKNKSEITTQSYLEFASAWNSNPDNKYKLKSTILGLKNVLWAKKPVDRMQYIHALIFDEIDVIEKLEKEYDETLCTVYNNETLKQNIYSLVKDNILTEDSLGSIKYVTIFAERCAEHICKKTNIDFKTLSQRDKYKLINKTYGISGVPSSLTVALWWLQSRDSLYQKLLLQKFVAIYEKRDESYIKSIQEKIDEREPRIAEWLWWVEKNIFKEYKVQSHTQESLAEENNVQELIVEEPHEDQAGEQKTNTRDTVDAIIIKAPVLKELITVTPEELEAIPENVVNTIRRVVKIVHTASIDGQIDQIIKLLLYWYVYCRKNPYLKKDTEKPYSYFSKFYQEKYIIEICTVATEIPDMFKLAFAFSCTERKMWSHIKRILEIQWITNKRK